MSGDMRIRTWTARNWGDYETRVQSKIHALLSSLGGNSIYAELSIAEALRALIGARDAEVLIRAILIERDLRFILHSEWGEFPTDAVCRHVRAFVKDEKIKILLWQTFADMKPEHRNIWRILAPVELACLDVSGKKVTLLFRYPFESKIQRTIGELAQNLRIERDEIIYGCS